MSEDTDHDRGASTVCVTGASGFVASQLIADLLAAGHEVRGTVRGAPESERYAFLRELGERLTLHSADLLEEGSFADAVTGCDVVFHTASPYAITVKDAQRDLVTPAVQGTLEVLSACKDAGVRRVILTSSMAAVTDEPIPGHVFTEADWNERSSLTRNPYYFSKAEAERAAWSYVEREAHPFELVVVNPFMVIGPSISPSLNTSNEMLRDIIMGKYPGILDLGWGFVDVRDVSLAHMRAATDGKDGERYLCVGESLHMRELVALLGELGFADKYKLPRRDLTGKLATKLMKFAANFQPSGVRSYLVTHLGKQIEYDNRKIVEHLSMEFRPVRESIADTLESLIEHGHLADRRAR